MNPKSQSTNEEQTLFERVGGLNFDAARLCTYVYIYIYIDIDIDTDIDIE